MTPPAPDVVGLWEAAEILGTETPQLVRWRTSGKVPRPAAKVTATWVWHRADVEFMRDHPDVPPSELPFSGPLDLIGTAEAANICRVNKSQIGRWRRAGQFPEPALDRQSAATPNGLRATSLWWRDDVVRWHRAREREKTRRARAAAGSSSSS